MGRLGRFFVLAQSAVIIYGALKAARSALKSRTASVPPQKRLPAPRRRA